MATGYDDTSRGGFDARLSWGAILGPALLTAAWIGLGLVSPGFTLFGRRIAPYDWIAQPISGLGLGPTGPWMNAAFLAAGVLLLAGVVGALAAFDDLSPKTRALATGLLALTPAGMAMDGVFTLESFLPHFAGFGLATLGPVAGFAATGWMLRKSPGRRGLARLLMWASPVTLGLFVWAMATFDPATSGAGRGIAGLSERVLIVFVCAVYAALGWAGLRARR